MSKLDMTGGSVSVSMIALKSPVLQAQALPVQAVQAQVVQVQNRQARQQPVFGNQSLNSSGWGNKPQSLNQASESPSTGKAEKFPIHEEYELMKVNIPQRDKQWLSLGGLLAAMGGLFAALSGGTSDQPLDQKPLPQAPEQVQTQPKQPEVKADKPKPPTNLLEQLKQQAP